MSKNRNNEVFPIKETNGEAKMQNISPTSLPKFRGLISEDPDTFMFEFSIVYRTYDYAFDDQKMKLFPSTLKDATLRWFINLLGGSITTWPQIQQAFNEKYMEYCRSKQTNE